MERNSVTFGEAVRHWRKDKGLTQAQLAARIKIHPQYVSDIERGKRAPGMRVAMEIRRISGGTVSLDLLGEAA